MSNIRRRLQLIEHHVDQGELSGEKVRAAMRAWTERGELPENPKLRECVVDIFAALDAMRASMNDFDDEPVIPSS